MNFELKNHVVSGLWCGNVSNWYDDMMIWWGDICLKRFKYIFYSLYSQNFVHFVENLVNEFDGYFTPLSWWTKKKKNTYKDAYTCFFEEES